MARRGRKPKVEFISNSANGNENKGDCAVIMAVIIGLFIAFIALTSLPREMLWIIASQILLFYLIYRYSVWQKKRLLDYDGNWFTFYHAELKEKLQTGTAVLLTLLGIILLFYRPTPAVCLLGVGTLLYVRVDKLLQKYLYEPYFKKGKWALIGSLGILGVSINSEHQKEVSQQFRGHQAIETQQQLEELIQEKQLKIQSDKLDRFYSIARTELKNKNYQKSLALMDSSLQIATGTDTQRIQYTKALVYESMGQYQKSMNILSKLPHYGVIGVPDDEFYLHEGRGYLKAGKGEDAAHSFKRAAEKGNPEAEKLFDKANPILKEVIGYETQCCDGTTSNARGRGACSHHGGVCNWNKPIYRERRKYDIEIKN